jgi:hypothetical protein
MVVSLLGTPPASRLSVVSLPHPSLCPSLTPSLLCPPLTPACVPPSPQPVSLQQCPGQCWLQGQPSHGAAQLCDGPVSVQGIKHIQLTQRLTQRRLQDSSTRQNRE